MLRGNPLISPSVLSPRGTPSWGLALRGRKSCWGRSRQAAAPCSHRRVFPSQNMWIERTVYTTAYKLPGILRWFEVKSVFMVRRGCRGPRSRFPTCAVWSLPSAHAAPRSDRLNPTSHSPLPRLFVLKPPSEMGEHSRWSLWETETELPAPHKVVCQPPHGLTAPPLSYRES